MGRGSILLFSIFFLASLANGQSLCSTVGPCQAFQGSLLSLEIPPAAKTGFAKAGSSVIVPLPEKTCVYKGQSVHLHIRGAQNQLIMWGRGVIDDIRTTPEQNSVVVSAQPLITDDILAPHCQGTCSAVVDRLPPSSPQRVLIDLRRKRDLLLEIPDAVSIPMPAPAQFPWAKFPNKTLSYYLIPESSKLSESSVIPLMRELRTRGYSRVYWYYPGALGLTGVELPAQPPSQLRQVRNEDLAALRRRGARMMYVGMKADYRNLKSPPLPNMLSFFREKAARIPSISNPFETRITKERFDFSLKSITRRTPLVIYDRDATDPFKYQAAQALRSMGYNELYILPSGLLGLIESGPL